MTEKIATILVARARNGVIGLNNTLPWHLPEDLQHFKHTTMGHALIMGRKTFESINRQLPGRQMIVLTRDPKLVNLPSWVKAVSGLDQALQACEPGRQAFVVGGAQIYRLAMPYCKELIVTEIEKDFVGDAWFDQPEANEWIRASHESFISKTGLPYSIQHYARRTPGKQGQEGLFA